MSRHRRCSALLSLLLAVACTIMTCPAGAAAAEPDSAAAMARGRQLTAWFFGGTLDSVHGSFSGRMAQYMSVENLQIFRNQVDGQLGAETKLMDESVTPQDSLRVYRRLSTYQKFASPVEVVWSLDRHGQVAGFHVRPPQSAAPSKYFEYQTKTPLRLPFDGTWLVVWGGRTVGQNYHAAARDQRFAYDILVQKDGGTHTGDGKSNEQYYAFGQPIVAPGAGVVVEAVDGVADNVPGSFNDAQPIGNHVILDHGNGEFSFVAHLQKGSVRVKKGQKVKAGDALGLCGNSGRSTEPHLHYHMQTTAKPFEGDGLPAFFLNYVANGSKVERGEPVQGQTISMP